MNTTRLKKALYKLKPLNLFHGNCGAFAVGLASALGTRDCELVWIEDLDTYGVYHCALYHKPTGIYLDGRGYLPDGIDTLVRESAHWITPVVYRKPVNARSVREVLSKTDWRIHPKRFERAMRKALV